MPSNAELCRVMLTYAELCWVMLSYAELCQLMPCVEDNSQCVEMTTFILSYHIFWEDEKILFPSDFHSHSSRAIYHQKRSSYQSNHNSHRLRYLIRICHHPKRDHCDTYKRRQLWRDKRLSGCVVKVFDSTLNCRDNDREKRQWKIYALGLN